MLRVNISIFCDSSICVRTEFFCTYFLLLWRYTVISTNNKDLPINEEIKVPEVRLIGSNNEQLGVMSIDQARAYADDNGVDLVLIAPTANPPVCRAIDYGKFCFERDKREKEAKKKQVTVKVKEVQLSCRIEQHDFDTRVNQAKRFLAEGNKLRVTLMFKGREMAHQEMGFELINKVIEDLKEDGVVDSPAKLFGKNIQMTFNPKGGR